MPDIESLLKEKRSFKPSPEFAKQANWSKIGAIFRPRPSLWTGIYR